MTTVVRLRSTPDRRARPGAAIVALFALIVPAAVSSDGASAGTEPPTESSDAVRTWNMHGLEALFGADQTNQVTAMHLAMMHGAIYDAVNSIEGGHQPYLSGLAPASPTASLEAAATTAAHDVLVGLETESVPALPPEVIERLDTLYDEALAGIPDDAVKSDGIAAGAAAAAAMLAERENDGRYVPYSFTAGEDPGEWRLDNGNDEFAWVGQVDPFMLDSPSQFRSSGPHELTSDAYTAEYNEVKELGAAAGPRDVEQEAIAQFFSVSPVEMFNRTFRGIAESEGLTLVDEARLFAMLNMAAADSSINCWNDKDFWSFWRPVTAIHEGDNDGNDSTVGDPTWAPLLGTPPYPDHTSGYNCATGGMMHAARIFFGSDTMDFSLVGPDQPDVVRTYAHFTDVIDDTIDARVYQGIHFRAADVQGALIGENVADWMGENFFQPAG